jgi:hypothetical protein
MKLASSLVALGLLVSANGNAGTSRVIGRAISEDDDVRIEQSADEVCPPDAICLYGWSRWTLDIERSLSGPAVTGRIHAVHMQHTTHNHFYFHGLHQFALEYIADASERKRLHSDYKLLDLVDEKRMLCTKVDPQSAGIPADDVYAGTTEDSYKSCFVDPDHKQR